MSEKIYDTPRLVIETKDITLPNGKERKYLFVQPVEAVCILPTDDEYVYLTSVSRCNRFIYSGSCCRRYG